VAVNQFNGIQQYPLDVVADALALRPEVPIMSVDARDRESAKRALIRVTEYALQRLTESFSTTVS
jgi:signal recognition particle receptor subunit beta